MAKLAPKDPEFGIPIACRIKEDIAFQLNKTAEHAGKTLSRYLAEFIEQAVDYEKRIKKLERQAAYSKRALSRFIKEISEDAPEQVERLIDRYNSMLKNEKSN